VHDREELARDALARRALLQHDIQALGAQARELERQEERLRESEKRLRQKLESFRARKEVIKAQYSAAEAQAKIGEAATGVAGEMADVALAIQRAEDKTASMQARAAAVEELEGVGGGDPMQLGAGDELERELAKLDLDLELESELERLKEETLLAAEPVRALEEGKPAVDQRHTG
jgi:phage shock protein A